MSPRKATHEDSQVQNMARKKKTPAKKQVETLTHDEAKRANIPTAEHQSVMRDEDKSPVQVAYERRNKDLDPQLVWRGKDQQDWSDLVVQAPPLYIQEKVHPKILIDDLQRHSELAISHSPLATQLDLFGDFNSIPEGVDKTEFYQHDANWTNRMILGDSLQVMASLAEREGLRGKVQCIYLDPPYGIKFNSNFQWSTTSRDVKDGNVGHITREPEQVKAFRDTWRDGIHSYLTYLRDRLTVARDLLTESGSIFVQIGDENVHRVRALMDEVFGDDQFVLLICYKRLGTMVGATMQSSAHYLLWYVKNREMMKSRKVFQPQQAGVGTGDHYTQLQHELTRIVRPMTSTERSGNQALSANMMPFQLISLATGNFRPNMTFTYEFEGRSYHPGHNKHWRTGATGLARLRAANRLSRAGKTIRYKQFLNDFPVTEVSSLWTDTGRDPNNIYVVQTPTNVIKRCLMMATDPGDLVLDPTCGSGTTAFVAEQWGRRWITIDTSRVALALARARIMGARYPYYLLADSKEGQRKEAELSRTVPSDAPTHGNIRHGFIYERVPHIMLGSIANNAEIDIIWEKYQEKLEPLRAELNEALGESWEEWGIPTEAKDGWSASAKKVHAQWWEQRIARQKEIDASIAAMADCEYLYDKPYEDKKTVRVAGPFTVESLSPHRMLAVDEEDELIDTAKESQDRYGAGRDFPSMILENLKAAGVQQAHKEDRITFTSLTPWPGELVCGEGFFDASGELRVNSGEQAMLASGSQGASKKKGNKSSSRLATNHSSLSTTQRAAIFIGPEFGTVSRPDLVRAAREAGDAGFDVLVACAFNYDAHSSDFEKLGRIPILKARMNADLHMAEELKTTGKGNLFVIFGEPDIEVVSGEWLVASNGRLVAHYESCKELSGLGSLEEINRLGGTDLPRFQQLSAGRTLRPDQPDTPGGGVGSVQHRGGRGARGDTGVLAVSERSERVAGGSGDPTDSGGAAGLSDAGGPRSAERGGGRNQPNAGWTQALAAIESLTPGDFPLSLATSHYAQITVRGVDVFHPQTGEVRSDGPEGIACWFLDTDYNEESFFVRHAYFLGQSDPYKSLKTTLKAEINEEAWATLNSDTSRPFDKPKNGRIAVKIINHLGDEVMKVFRA